MNVTRGTQHVDWPWERLGVALVLVTLIAGGCGRSPHETAKEAPAADGSAWFEDVATRRGLGFVHQSGHKDHFLLPEIMGGGAALFDMDGDGFLDVYLVQSGSVLSPSSTGNRLFRNRGDGTFEDVTLGSGADLRGYGMGVTAGDYDGDGKVDLYVTQLGHNVLLHNDGRGHFTDVTATAGVASAGWSTSSMFMDYDGDGRLDLFVLHYITWSSSAEVECRSLTGVLDYCSPGSYDAPTSATLYRNNGNGTFADVSEQAGFQTAGGNGLGVVAGDFNGDGRLDIFVANDGTPNNLWINDGHGRFEDRALIMGCAIDQDGKPKAGMGVHAVDIDDDGDLDLLVVNLDGETDSLYRNEHGFFVDDTAAVGLRTTSRPFTRFGAGLLDFNNDGLLDLFEANGRVGLQFNTYSADPYAEPNLLFRGLPGGRFEEVKPRGGTTRVLVATSRAAAFGDIDNDGGIDVLVANRDGPPHLLHNIVRTRGHWIQFKVIDESGRDALGATVTAALEQRRIRRDVMAAYSYLASNDPRVHIGLGSETRVRDVAVRWLDGRIELFGEFAADRIVTLQRGRAFSSAPLRPTSRSR